MAHLVAMFTYCYSVFNIVEICVLSVIEIRIRSVRRYLVKKKRSKKPSLITPHSIFVTHHLSLKIPQFPKPCTFETLFSTSHHSNICTFCGTYTWALGQKLLLAYPPHPYSPPFSLLLISPSPLQPCYSPKIQTWTHKNRRSLDANLHCHQVAWPISPTCIDSTMSSVMTQWHQRNVKKCDPFPWFVTDSLCLSLSLMIAFFFFIFVTN